MEVRATVRLTEKELFGFLMHHTYATTSGAVGIILSLLGFVGFFYMLGVPDVNPVYLCALFVTGLLFTVVQPAMIYYKAKKQAKMNMEIEEGLEYTIGVAGINVVQGEKTGFSTWDEIVKVTSTKSLVMLYTSRVHAYVIPKKNVAEQLDKFKDTIRENCHAGYIKLK